MSKGCIGIELNTAERNKRAIAAYKHFGFQMVDFKANRGGDHYSVVMMKWFETPPYLKIYVRIRYLIKKIYIKCRFTQSKEERWRK